MNNRIRQLRQRNSMKQSELACFLGVSQGTLSNWERGEYEPDNKTLVKLSHKFNVTTDYLLGQISEKGSVYNAQNIKNSRVVQGEGNVLNDVEDENSLSIDESELVRIYRLLTAKSRHKLMSFAFDLEEFFIREMETE